MHNLLASGGDGLETRSWNNTPITRRAADGHVNATAMAKANGKEWNNYFQTNRASTYIKALSRNLEIQVADLCIAKPGEGTWIHPRLAVDFARWISAEFAVWMDGWLLEALGQAPRPQPAPAPVDAAVLSRPLQDSVAALLLIGQAIAQLPGVKPGVAMAQTLACIEQNTGLATEPMHLALPAAEGPVCSLNPTKLGKLLGLNGKKANLLLAEYGFQARNANDDWELTEKGRAFAEAIPYSNNRSGHSGYRILWNEAVVEQLPLNAQP